MNDQPQTTYDVLNDFQGELWDVYAVIDCAMAEANELGEKGTSIFGALKLAKKHLHLVINAIDAFSVDAPDVIRDAVVSPKKKPLTAGTDRG